MKAIILANRRPIEYNHPLIMGIINCTPDSFAVRYDSTGAAVDGARRMIEEGADILDVGGESSRPGSDPIAPDIELKRVIPVITALRKYTEIPIAIDTTKAEVARKALDAGADIVNDISALAFDSDMAGVVESHNCPVVLMHIKGMPKTMQNTPHYDDVITEVSEYFRQRIAFAASCGIDKSRLILDIGIGFGKRTIDNLTLLKHLGDFKRFDLPLVAGASRKRFIGEITGAAVEDRIHGSIAAAVLASHNGADIIRVHDVAATRQALAVATAIREA